MWKYLIVGSGLLLSTISRGAEPVNITPAELARVPEYCADTMAFDPRLKTGQRTARQSHWLFLMGETFYGMHHYCWALIGANRAEQAGLNEQQRAFIYNSAINDVYYVLKVATPGFPMLPELLTRIGQYYVALGLPVQAVDHFEQARKMKPDYWPPYIGMAEVYAKLGRKQQAREVLDDGLKLMPDEVRLKEAKVRLAREGSKPAKQPAKRSAASSP